LPSLRIERRGTAPEEIGYGTPPGASTAGGPGVPRPNSPARTAYHVRALDADVARYHSDRDRDSSRAARRRGRGISTRSAPGGIRRPNADRADRTGNGRGTSAR